MSALRVALPVDPRAADLAAPVSDEAAITFENESIFFWRDSDASSESEPVERWISWIAEEVRVEAGYPKSQS